MRMNTQTPGSSSRNPLLLVVSVVAVLLLAVVAVFAWLQASSAQRQVDALQTVRSTLHIPDSWTPYSETVDGPGLFGLRSCNFGATECPKVTLMFLVDEPADADELARVLPDADWTLGNVPCDPKSNVWSSNLTTCSNNTTVEGFDVAMLGGGEVNNGVVTEPWVRVELTYAD